MPDEKALVRIEEQTVDFYGDEITPQHIFYGYMKRVM
jgi:lipid-binding SYLF domain-containing protein